jgi:hypothetical protein
MGATGLLRPKEYAKAFPAGSPPNYIRVVRYDYAFSSMRERWLGGGGGCVRSLDRLHSTVTVLFCVAVSVSVPGCSSSVSLDSRWPGSCLGRLRLRLRPWTRKRITVGETLSRSDLNALAPGVARAYEAALVASCRPWERAMLWVRSAIIGNGIGQELMWACVALPVLLRAWWWAKAMGGVGILSGLGRRRIVHAGGASEPGSHGAA